MEFVIVCLFSHYITENSFHKAGRNLVPNIYHVMFVVLLFVFLALQPIVVVFSQPSSGL